MIGPKTATGALSPAPSRYPVTSMTVNRNEERVAEGTNGGGPSRPVGKKLTQVASAGRQVLGKTAGPARKPGKGRRPSQAERSKAVSSGRKRRFFNYPRAGKGKIHRWIPSWRFVLGSFLLVTLALWDSFLPTGRLGPPQFVPSATRSSFRLTVIEGDWIPRRRGG